MSVDRIPSGIPERRLDPPEEDRASVRAGRSAPPTQLCRGYFGRSEHCRERLPRGTHHCAACAEHIRSIIEAGR